MKKSSVFEWHKQFKESSYGKITNEDNAYHLSLVHFEFILQGQMSTRLIMWNH